MDAVVATHFRMKSHTQLMLIAYGYYSSIHLCQYFDIFFCGLNIRRADKDHSIVAESFYLTSCLKATKLPAVCITSYPDR